MSQRTVFVGVDGGGSRCRVRLCDDEGAVLASVEGGAANVYLDFHEALRTIRGCVGSALAQVHGLGGHILRLGLGLAGTSSIAVANAIEQALVDLGPATVAHDGEVACIGAHDGQDGGLVIAGTGSAGVLRVGGRATAIGGRGFILGDDGSGARLGLEAWRRALRAHDGFEPHTALSRALMADHGDDPVAVIRWARSARSTDFAHYVPLVFMCAAERDPMALDLVANVARSVAELGDALVRRGAPRLCLVGGLAGPIRPYLSEAFRQRLSDPLRDALDGALLLAGCRLPAPNGNDPPRVEAP